MHRKAYPDTDVRDRCCGDFDFYIGGKTQLSGDSGLAIDIQMTFDVIP
jgi:hypothetical protein